MIFKFVWEGGKEGVKSLFKDPVASAFAGEVPAGLSGLGRRA